MSATLGARIRARREELQLSLQGLADATAGTVSKATVHAIEGGSTPNPGLDKLRALAGALGWTLDELDGTPASGVRAIQLQHLQPDPNNPRVLQEGDAADAAFVHSIRDVGLIQPLAVRALYSLDEAGKRVLSSGWMVVDGHRRYAALVSIHGPKSKTLVPCRIVEADDTQTLLMQLVANVQRADMNPWDLARAIGSLADQKMDTQAIADALGRKRRWVQEMASVGRKAANGTRNALMTGRISISQAIAIVAAKDEAAQHALVTKAADDGLNEDEIRAIIADAKAQDVIAANSRQVDIEELVPPAPKAWPVANEHGVFIGSTQSFGWNHRRGEFRIHLVQYGDDKWCAGYETSWRVGSTNGGGMSADPTRTQFKQPTAALSFKVAAQSCFAWMVGRAKNWPEDAPAMRDLHDWVERTMRTLGATGNMVADWRENHRAPEKPATAAKAPAPKAAPPEEEKPIDPTVPPRWTTPEWLAGPFMYHDGRYAWLVHGWPKLLQLVLKNDKSGRLRRDLYTRGCWQSDDDGKPFDFGSCVIRLTHALP